MTIAVGDPAPAFRLEADDGTQVSLSDFAGRKLVVYFYPKAFTPGCTKQACDLRDRYETFIAAGFAVVGVSPDDRNRLARFRAEHRLPFPLLSDPDHTVAAAYGAWGLKKNYGREYQGIIRSTFTIDESGVVSGAWHNVKASGHADRLLTHLG